MHCSLHSWRLGLVWAARVPCQDPTGTAAHRVCSLDRLLGEFVFSPPWSCSTWRDERYGGDGTEDSSGSRSSAGEWSIRDDLRYNCVRPQVDPGPLLSASASSISYTRSSLSVSIPSPAPDRRRISRAPVTGGAITKQLVRDRSRTNHNSYVPMGCMQPVVPNSLGISVSLAGRN